MYLVECSPTKCHRSQLPTDQTQWYIVIINEIKENFTDPSFQNLPIYDPTIDKLPLSNDQRMPAF